MGTQLPSPKGTQPPIFGPYQLLPNGCMDQDVTWYGARPRPRRLCVRGGPRSRFSAHVYCGQTAGWMQLILGMVVGLSPSDFVLDGDPAAPSPKRGRAPSSIFGPFLLWPNGWMHQHATWYGCRPQPRGLCVRWRPSPRPQNGAEPSPQFLAHVYCGQTAGWIKMPLGTKVGLCPGDSVLGGDPAPSAQRGGAPSPIFGPFLFWPNGWMHQDATWYRGRPQTRGLWIRWGPTPLPKGRWRLGADSLPNFSPMAIVAERLDGSIWHLAWR